MFGGQRTTSKNIGREPSAQDIAPKSRIKDLIDGKNLTLANAFLYRLIRCPQEKFGIKRYANSQI